LMETTVPTLDRLEVRRSDGRRLDVRVSGQAGLPLVFHHGTPGSNSLFAPWVEAASRRGLQFVTYSRPGYGGSDRAEGRSIGDSAADVAAILDVLHANRCVTVGASGGGDHALAVAALLPDRTLAAATVGGLGMFGVSDLDFFAGMDDGLSVAYRLAAALDLSSLVRYFEGIAGSAFSEGQLERLAIPDIDALTGGFGAHLAADSQEAFRNGPWGAVDDVLSVTRPWGFDPGAITAPVTIWQGGQDAIVPPVHGAWLAAHVSGATEELRPEHGHFSLAVTGFEEVIDSVVASAQAILR